MQQETTQREIQSFVYEPGIYGLAGKLWYVDSGVPLLVSDSGVDYLNLPAPSADYTSETVMYSVPTFIGGIYKFNIILEDEPATDDAAGWGLAGLDDDDREILFKIVDDELICRTVSGGTAEETTIVPDATWATNNVVFEIQWSRNHVKFLANGKVLADHYAQVPTMQPLRLYMYNSSDAATTTCTRLDVNSIDVQDARIINPTEVFTGANRSQQLVNVAAGAAADDTYEFFFDGSGLDNFAIQYQFAGTGTGTLTVEGTQQEANPTTRDISDMDFQDITNAVFGVASATTSSMFIADTPITMKAYKVKLVLSGSAGDTEYRIDINSK